MRALALVGCVEAATLAASGCGSKAANAPFMNDNPGGSSGGSSSSSGGGRSSSSGTSSSGATSSSSSSSSGGVSSSSSGGSSSGGSSSGATDAGADAQTVPCMPKVTIPATNPVLVNFDTYNGMTSAASFQVVFGGPTVATWAPLPTIVGYTGLYGFSGGMTNYSFSMVTGRSGGTIDGGQDWGLDFMITQEAVYGGSLGFWMSCTDARAFRGISFWSRGQVPMNTFSLTLGTADTTLAANGGTCAGTATTCSPPIAANQALTLNWTQSTVLWSTFTGGNAGGSPYTPAGDNLTGLTFNFGLTYTAVDAGPDGAAIYGPTPATIDFQIDDIQFLP